ncbi:MAG: lysophospholipid acyltransferase family protein [Casimicrobiaceae bacterium]
MRAPSTSDPPTRAVSLRARVAVAVADWLARRPLATQYRIGGWLGRLALLFSSGLRRRLRENLAIAGYDGRVSLLAVGANLGRMAIETLALWRTPTELAQSRLLEVYGWDQVRAARKSGQGVIFLTPHLGTFEYAALMIGAELPFTVMYRPPREAWADPLMREGRTRQQMRAVPADFSGVRAMLGALRRGEAIGILPDQVPDADRGGEGVWAPFFGRPAYTMTLVPTLAARTGARVFMVSTIRLRPGANCRAGFRVHFDPVEGLTAPPGDAARMLNAAVERAIAYAPEQYLWSYNRYKVPRGAPEPPTGRPIR